MQRREFITLLGANGAGKTTLFRALTGILVHRNGEIVFRGRNITALRSHEIVRLGIAHIAEGKHLFGPPVGGGEPGTGRAVRARRAGGRAAAGAGTCLSALSPAARPAAPARSDAVGRRAADARHRSRDDGTASRCSSRSSAPCLGLPPCPSRAARRPAPRAPGQSRVRCPRIRDRRNPHAPWLCCGSPGSLRHEAIQVNSSSGCAGFCESFPGASRHEVQPFGGCRRPRRSSAVRGAGPAFVRGTSRISREAYVRFCEGLGVKFPGPTRHSRHFPLSRRVRFAPRAERLLGRPAAGGLPLSGAAAVKGTPHRSSRCCRSATVPRSRARWRRRCAGRGLSPSPHGDLDIISKPGNASFANCCQLRCQIGFFGLFALAVSHLSL
jgi:energy-coupling factor transporter ATP-binding protein EcfA2